MRYFVLALCVLLATTAVGEPEKETQSATAQNSVTNSLTFAGIQGYIEAIYVDIAAADSTNAITVASGRDTILSAVSVAADTSFYPRIQAKGSDGNVISGVYARPFLASMGTGADDVTVTITTSSVGTTGTVSVTVLWDTAK